MKHRKKFGDYRFVYRSRVLRKILKKLERLQINNSNQPGLVMLGLLQYLISLCYYAQYTKPNVDRKANYDTNKTVWFLCLSKTSIFFKYSIIITNHLKLFEKVSLVFILKFVISHQTLIFIAIESHKVSLLV